MPGRKLDRGFEQPSARAIARAVDRLFAVQAFDVTTEAGLAAATMHVMAALQAKADGVKAMYPVKYREAKARSIFA